MNEARPSIRPYEAADLESLHQVILNAAEADNVDPDSTLESIPTREELRLDLEARTADGNQNVLVATDEQSGEVIGYGMIRWWQEDSGTFVYLHEGSVDPTHRRKGIGAGMLTKLEEEINHIAAMHPATATRVYGTNATETEAGANELLQKHGYERVHSSVEMRFAGLNEVKRLETPEGYELRPVNIESDTRAVYEANKLIYAGQFGSSPVSEVDYQEFLEENPDTALWKVLWRNDRIAGFVLSKAKDTSAEIVEVSVMPEFRRLGLGKYLMLESLLEFRDRGAADIRLHTDAAGKMGGRQLYEEIGFVPLKVHHRYRKSLQS